MSKTKQLVFSKTLANKIPEGTYLVEDLLGLVKGVQKNGGLHSYIDPILSKYTKGNTINIKYNKGIVYYTVAYYGKWSTEINKELLAIHCHRMSKNRASQFWTDNAKELIKVLGKDFDNQLLNFIFTFYRIPKQFEIYFKDEKVDNPFDYKEQWKKSPKSFKVISYIKN